MKYDFARIPPAKNQIVMRAEFGLAP